MTSPPSDPSRFRPNPIEHLEARVSVAQRDLQRSQRLGITPHYSYRTVDQSAWSGGIRTGVNFDYQWDCPECRQYKEYREGMRILEAFEHADMWVTVGDAEDRDALVTLAQSQGHSYVALPVFGDDVVVLTTGRIDLTSEKVSFNEHFMKKTVMAVRWVGPISSTRGFLPPARELPPFSEAYHKGTSRRCWHAHETQDEAKACAVETGVSLDGSAKGWYTRRFSGWVRLGIFRATGDELEEIIKSLGIKSWRGPAYPDDSENTRLNIEAMGWADPRFVLLRELAGWRPPTRQAGTFQPPPFAISVQVDVRGGTVGGQVQKGAS